MHKPNFLQGQFDYELAAQSENYNTQDHLRAYVAFLDRVARLINVKPE